MVLECGGNGRSFFTPQARGNQWTNGGAGCAEWTGIPLAVLLRAAGVKPSAVYTANYGTDVHLSGDPKRETLSRGVPIAKAMNEHSLLVWAMNGQPLANIHGGPLRLVHPGWPGSTSHKWLSKITLRDKVHDGQGMLGTSYRVAIKPMMPGGKADDSNFKILESMPVRSIITNPPNGTRLPAGTREVRLRGAAWAGDLEVRRVDVSTDFGATWRQAALAPPKNRFDWRRWTATLRLPSDGYYEVWARATDSRRQDATPCRRQLEPAGLRRQPDAPHRRAGRAERDAATSAARSLSPLRGERVRVRGRTAPTSQFGCPSPQPSPHAGGACGEGLRCVGRGGLACARVALLILPVLDASAQAGASGRRRKRRSSIRPAPIATTRSTSAPPATASRSWRSRACRASAGTRPSTSW